ncbi:MAG: HAD hydrolase-like protein [Caulobacter sp.]|nr:HAD hydrolase-like protein [Caulobacter sp.]
MPAYRLAIFDFDGTLGDTMGWMLDASDQMAEKFGFRKIDRSQLDTLRTMTARDLMKLQRLPALKLPIIAAHFHTLMASEAGTIRMFDGAPETLRSLHAAGVKLAVVSSNTEANIRIVLGDELSGLVSQFACGATVFGKASKFRRVLKALGVAPADAVSIGDEIRDLDAAREVGLATAVVCWGYTAPDALKAQRPDHVFETMGEIVGRIG